MLRKTVLLFFSVSLFAVENNQSNNNLFTTRNVLIASGVVVTAGAVIIFAPVVLPASTIAAMQVSAAAATAKVTAAATTTKISFAFSATMAGVSAVGQAIDSKIKPIIQVVDMVKPIAENINDTILVGQIIQKELYPTTAQKNERLRLEEELESSKAKKDFSDCLMKHKASINRNAPKVPSGCEKLSGMLAISAGYAEVKRILEDSSK